MSQVAISGNASGTGVFTIQSPNSNTSYTQTLPAATGTVVLDTNTQTLTNKTVNGGCITSGTAVASTSGTSIDFTGIPSWVKRITVMLSDVSTSGTSVPQIQLGSGSATTSGYQARVLNIQSTTPTTGSFTSGFGLIVSGNYAATSTLAGTVVFALLSSNTWIGTGNIVRTDVLATTVGSLGGNITLSGTLDRVRITTVNGTDTFDAGSINILYEG